MTETKISRVVSAAIVRNGHVLMTQRNETQPFPLKWEFPGGKIEPGEFRTAALIRELLEELGIIVKLGHPDFMDTVRISTQEKHYIVHIYKVTEFSGAPKPLVGQKDLRWVPLEDLGLYDQMPSQQCVIPQLLKEYKMKKEQKLSGGHLYVAATDDPEPKQWIDLGEIQSARIEFSAREKSGYKSPFHGNKVVPGHIVKHHSRGLILVTEVNGDEFIGLGLQGSRQMCPVRDLLQCVDVIVHLDTLEGEMKDFSMLIDHCSQIYMHATDGEVSNPLTLPSVVKSISDDRTTDLCKQHMEDELEHCVVLNPDQAFTAFKMMDELSTPQLRTEEEEEVFQLLEKSQESMVEKD